MSVNAGLSSQAFGYSAMVLVAFFYGSNYVPAKKCQTGDGMAFQWFMAVGIFFWTLLMMFLGGFVPAANPSVYCADTLLFNWWGVLGGAFWATGNVMVPKIIEFIGMGMGMLVWGATNFLVGWIIGLAGLGDVLAPATLVTPALNIVGGIVGVASMLIFAFIKPTLAPDAADATMARESLPHYGETSPLQAKHETPMKRNVSEGATFSSRFDSMLDHEIKEVSSDHHHHHYRDMAINEDHGGAEGDDGGAAPPGTYELFGRHLTPTQARFMGIGMAVLSGCFYGFNLIPFQIWTESVGPGGYGPLNYVFSQGLGIFLLASLVFMVYMLVNRSPQVFTASIMPSILCGMMWMIATVSWMFMNSSLSLAVGYPVGAITPNLVSSIWSVFYFKEIQGRRNLLLLCIGLLLLIVSVVLILLSKLNL
jgi:drug/metabolite transporter (DMT)-like permease